MTTAQVNIWFLGVDYTFIIPDAPNVEYDSGITYCLSKIITNTKKSHDGTRKKKPIM
jgi:hypothetical protein